MLDIVTMSFAFFSFILLYPLLPFLPFFAVYVMLSSARRLFLQRGRL